MGSEGIGRDNEYQRKLPLLDRRKLFTPRDVSGEPNLKAPSEGEEYGTETHELVRTLQRELGSQESFVSITPMGSIMRGHSNANSDIDIMVLVDDTNDMGALRKVYGIYQNEAALMREKGVLKRHVHEIFLTLSPMAIQRLLYQKPSPHIPDDQIDETEMLRCALVGLCGPAVGPRVEEYRHMVGQMIREMPPEQASEFLKDLAMTAMDLEENSKVKRIERIPPLSRRSEAKSDKARIKMWYSRIVTALDLKI